jgi:hypothetical protein
MKNFSTQTCSHKAPVQRNSSKNNSLWKLERVFKGLYSGCVRLPGGFVVQAHGSLIVLSSFLSFLLVIVASMLLVFAIYKQHWFSTGLRNDAKIPGK